MQELIKLDLIDPNPWQPRDGEDPEHVAKIAASIEAEGLMQVPVGRRVNGRVQLAFGHTRLAAFKLLRDKRIDMRYQLMPVQIMELSDEEMFRQGVGENLARKDLTPLEEARAMVRYRDDFGKTSEEIGALFGVADSTVRGKIRLLELPEDVQAQMREAAVSEGTARELVSLFDLPQEMREKAQAAWITDYHPSELVREALAGANANYVRERVTRIVRRYGLDLSKAPWKHDAVFLGAEIVGPCKGCPHRITREGGMWCIGPAACYQDKRKQFEAYYLAQASFENGVPALDGDYYSTFDHYGNATERALETAKSSKCENLRLRYVSETNERRPDLNPEGYPHAQYVCCKREGFCTCQKGAEVVVTAERRGEEAPAMESADDLKDLVKEERKRKRQDLIELRAMRDDVARRLADALEQGNAKTWARMLKAMTWQAKANETTPLFEIRAMIGEYLAERIYNTEDTRDPNLRYAFDRFNKELKLDGLEVMKSALFEEEAVAVETVTAAPVGKSLVEVFAAEEQPAVENIATITSPAVEGMQEGETIVAWMERTGQLGDLPVYGPDCERCGQPMPLHRTAEDGWKWYHCEKCDTWRGD